MFGLSDKIINEVQAVLSIFPKIDEALLYGSRAKGNYRDDSDIDIALLGKDLSVENTVKPLISKLEDIDCPHLFDITIYEKIDCPTVKKYVDDWGKIIYKKDQKET